MRRLAVLGVIAVLAAVGGTGSSASVSAQKTTFTGYGFDACSAPSPSPRCRPGLASPYRALGIYIGGANRACANVNLTPTWLASAPGARLQPPAALRRAAGAVRRPERPRADHPASAQVQGSAAADDASRRARALGLLAGTPIYFDMEGYATKNPACSQAVQAFLTGWVSQLHARGYRRRRLRQRRLDDSRHGDALAAARRRLDRELERQATVFGDPYVSDSLWAEPSAASTSTRAGIRRRGAASRSTSTATTSTAPSSGPAPRRPSRRRSRRPPPARSAPATATRRRRGRTARSRRARW